jgi:hypothetical protein
MDYYLYEKVQKPLTGFLASILYYWLIADPLERVEPERELLAIKRIRSKYNPTIFNSYQNGYNYGLSNATMENFRQTDYHDFMRLHTIYNDEQYTRARLIEEDLAKADLGNKNNWINGLLLYSPDLLDCRSSNLYFLQRAYSGNKSQNELDQPLIVNPNNSWVRYLYNPTDPYERNITTLSSIEAGYLRRSNWLSLQNLISPQMVGVKKIKLTDNTRFTFSLNYLRTVFGEMYEQNLWMMHNDNLSGIFIRQYVNHEHAGMGIGYKLYDTKLAKNLSLTTNLNYWNQPDQLSFYDQGFSQGFSLKQRIEFKFAEDKFIRRKNMSLFIGYDYKSKGYEPDNLYLAKNFDMQLGMRINIR